MIINSKAQSGATLIELLLYIVLLSMLLLSVFNIFSRILSTRNRSLSVSLIQRNGNFLLTKLIADIKSAQAVAAPVNIGGSDTTMSLRIGITTSVYTLNSGRLQVNSGSGNINLNDADTSVSNFIVKKFGNLNGKPALEIGFTLTSLVVEDNGQTKSESYHTITSLR